MKTDGGAAGGGRGYGKDSRQTNFAICQALLLIDSGVWFNTPSNLWFALAPRRLIGRRGTYSGACSWVLHEGVLWIDVRCVNNTLCEMLAKILLKDSKNNIDKK
jgi:hypothetical protein